MTHHNFSQIGQRGIEQWESGFWPVTHPYLNQWPLKFQPDWPTRGGAVSCDVGRNISQNLDNFTAMSIDIELNLVNTIDV